MQSIRKLVTLRIVRTHAKMVGGFRVEKIMASLSLKNITKIYPHSGDDAKKAKKAKKGEEPEKKKSNLKVTAEGVIAVQEFNLDIADKEFIVLVGPSGSPFMMSLYPAIVFMRTMASVVAAFGISSSLHQ